MIHFKALDVVTPWV